MVWIGNLTSKWKSTKVWGWITLEGFRLGWFYCVFSLDSFSNSFFSTIFQNLHLKVVDDYELSQIPSSGLNTTGIAFWFLNLYHIPHGLQAIQCKTKSLDKLYLTATFSSSSMTAHAKHILFCSTKDLCVQMCVNVWRSVYVMWWISKHCQFSWGLVLVTNKL